MPQIPHTRPYRSHDAMIYAGAIAATAGIFIVELQLPLAFSVGILYVLVIVLGLWTT